MRILLTRPAEDSERFADRLRNAGIETLIAPLMTVDLAEGPPLALAGVQALLVTSANGVRALARRTGKRDRTLPVYAVGDATAHEARTAGFTTVESAGGDVDDLSRLVAARCDPAAGALVHVAGSAVAGDLAGALGKRGFRYRREVLYAARPVAALPDEAAAALRENGLDAAALFSPRSAAILEQRVAEADLTPALTRVRAFALSGNVAGALNIGLWRAIEVAPEPTADALLKMVLDAAATG